MDEPISRAEYEEYKNRIDEENHRQNRRIELLEENVKQTGQLTSSVEKLANNMSNMVKEQEKQGKRLEALESRDGDMWRTVVGYIITAVIGIVLGFMAKQMGF